MGMATVTIDWTGYPPHAFMGGGVTVGNFDGVHRGHVALVETTRQLSSQINGPCLVVTFDPPPHQVLFGSPPRPPLTPLDERSRLLHLAGADHVVILNTGPALLALSAEAFFEDLLVRQLGAKACVEGFNFRFGRGRAGDTRVLSKLCQQAGLAFAEVAPFEFQGEPVSSSRVREALLRGELAAANELLGHAFRISGTVVMGSQRGRTIGFPTANLGNVNAVLPGNGVYAVWAMVEGIEYPAAANIGPNPTFGVDHQKIEVHLVGFSGDLYGKTLAIDFIQRLRDTRPFASVAELITQLKQDVNDARRILGDQHEPA